MQFFKPEILIKRQAGDIGVIVDTDDEWDEASLAYHRDLQWVIRRASPSVRALADLYLHDAVVRQMPIRRLEGVEKALFPAHCMHLVQTPGMDVLLDPSSHPVPVQLASDVLVAVQTEERLVVLTYKTATLTKSEAPKGWDRKTEPPIWLYDELRVDEGTPNWMYTHEILFSTGESHTIRFADVWVLEMEMS